MKISKNQKKGIAIGAVVLGGLFILGSNEVTATDTWGEPGAPPRIFEQALPNILGGQDPSYESKKEGMVYKFPQESFTGFGAQPAPFRQLPTFSGFTVPSVPTVPSQAAAATFKGEKVGISESEVKIGGMEAVKKVYAPTTKQNLANTLRNFIGFGAQPKSASKKAVTTKKPSMLNTAATTPLNLSVGLGFIQAQQAANVYTASKKSAPANTGGSSAKSTKKAIVARSGSTSRRVKFGRGMR